MRSKILIQESIDLWLYWHVMILRFRDINLKIFIKWYRVKTLHILQKIGILQSNLREHIMKRIPLKLFYFIRHAHNQL